MGSSERRTGNKEVSEAGSHLENTPWLLLCDQK